MKNNKQIEEMLREGLEKTAVPEGLGKKEIVEMLKKQKDFSDRTGNIIAIDAKRDNASKRNPSAVTLNRIATVAAAFVIVIACVVFAGMNSDISIVSPKHGYENYNSEKLIIGVSSYDEIEQAVMNALGKNEGSTKTEEKPSGNGQNPTDSTKPSAIADYKGAYIADETELLGNAVGIYGIGSEIIERFTGLEADIVKNNGEYLFVVTTGTDAESGGRVEIIKVIKALPADEMAVVSTVVLSDTSDAKNIEECIEIHLKDNVLIAVMSRNAYVMSDKAAYDKNSTVALYYDITDPASPVRIREHIQDGKYLTSGISEQGSLYLITEKSVSESETESVPRCTVNGTEIRPETENIFMAVNDPGAAFTFITVTDIGDLAKPVDCLAFFGSDSGRLCVSGNSILLSRGFISVEADKYGIRRNLTEIYRFDIDGASVSFAGSYAFKGALRGKPSISLPTGWLMAVAADTDSANLYVFNDKAELVSSLENILPGEKIKDVKFYGNSCYVVSDGIAEQTAVIDLTDPQKPVRNSIVSAKGFAGSLFGAGKELLIHIEQPSVKEESFKNISISLLGLSDPLNPVNLDLYSLSGISGGIANLDRRCIMIVPDESILGIPVIRTDPVTKEAVSAYALFNFADKDIKPIGYFNHDVKGRGETELRGTCIGDVFYSISGSKVVAFSIDEEEKLATVELN